MGWRDNLRPASFRGAKFFVEATARRGGRMTVLHEYPKRKEEPFLEDMGKAPRRHLISAYVLGEDFMAQRDLLLAALETEGPDVLVHPYLGLLVVGVEDFSLDHTTREGRMARFGIEFVETAPPLTVTQTTNAPAQAAQAAGSLKSAAAEGYTAALESSPDLPGSGVRQTLDAAQAVVDEISATLTAPDLLGLETLTDTVNSLGNLVVDVVRLFGFPEALEDSLAALEAAFTSSETAIDIFLKLDEHRAEQIGYLSKAARQGDLNAAATERLLRQSAIAHACELAAKNAWPSFEDALAMRRRLLDRIAALEADASDSSYQALLALRAGVVASVPPADESLPRLELLSPKSVTSSILLSFERFGDLAHESEICLRNRPRFPGLLSPAERYEVLVLDPA